MFKMAPKFSYRTLLLRNEVNYGIIFVPLLKLPISKILKIKNLEHVSYLLSVAFALLKGTHSRGSQRNLFSLISK